MATVTNAAMWPQIVPPSIPLLVFMDGVMVDEISISITKLVNYLLSSKLIANFDCKF